MQQPSNLARVTTDRNVDDDQGRLRSLISPFRTLIKEIGKFGVVGLIVYVVDLGLFNLLLYVGDPPLLADKPITSKAISVIVATTLSYGLNRTWTFSKRGGRSTRFREFVLFVFFNAIAMLIALACLALSHYVLGLDSPLADNISANVVGLVLGTIFRFWSYRTFVFPAAADEDDDDDLADASIV